MSVMLLLVLSLTSGLPGGLGGSKKQEKEGLNVFLLYKINYNILFAILSRAYSVYLKIKELS